jgi:hypothetical protein
MYGGIMRKLVLITCLLLPFASSANTISFKNAKDIKMGQIKKRITIFDTALACYKKASNKAQLSACNSKRYSAMEGLLKENQKLDSKYKNYKVVN